MHGKQQEYIAKIIELTEHINAQLDLIILGRMYGFYSVFFLLLIVPTASICVFLTIVLDHFQINQLDRQLRITHNQLFVVRYLIQIRVLKKLKSKSISMSICSPYHLPF